VIEIASTSILPILPAAPTTANLTIKTSK